MKAYCLLIAAVLQGSFCFTQNLVLNNEFEDTTTCPVGLDHLTAATGWRSYAGTADYFHTCAFSIFSKVPSNFFGYQQPSSDKAYASFYAYYTSYVNYREYVGSVLGTPLVKGTKYFISFKVALANKNDYSRVCNNLGMKFTNWDYWSGWPAKPDNSAHVYSAALVADTLNWTQISGSFIADSNYTRVMIGNFFVDSSTTHIGSSTQYGAYYYLDDICVATDSAFCYNYMGVEDIADTDLVTAFPNPFTEQINFETARQVEAGVIKLYDVLGQQICRVKFSGRQVILKREDLPGGIYFYQISSRDSIVGQGTIIAR